MSPHRKWDQNMVMSAFGEGGGQWALCICNVFGLQMISETRRTSMVIHFMLTDSLCS